MKAVRILRTLNLNYSTTNDTTLRKKKVTNEECADGTQIRVYRRKKKHDLNKLRLEMKSDIFEDVKIILNSPQLPELINYKFCGVVAVLERTGRSAVDTSECQGTTVVPI
jgi:hypothetical protein